jgi:two-component system, NarL family, captular synthesis response regulator RcsB
LALAIRAVIADDHPALLAGMEHLLSGVKDVTLVGLARDSTELVDLLGRHDVDVVVTDVSMPGGRYGDGIALLRFLKRRFPKVRLAVLTGVESTQVLQNILRIHVDVIVSKLDHYDCLDAAIHHAYEHQAYLSPAAQQLIEKEAAGNGENAPELKLSKRETEVLRMFAEGFSISEIGARIGRSRKTVSTQKMAAMRKLCLRTDADVYQYAIASGLVPASQISRAHAVEVENDPQISP